MQKSRHLHSTTAPNKGKPWSEADERVFQRMSIDQPDEVIAETLGRTTVSIWAHRYKVRQEADQRTSGSIGR